MELSDLQETLADGGNRPRSAAPARTQGTIVTASDARGFTTINGMTSDQPDSPYHQRMYKLPVDTTGSLMQGMSNDVQLQEALEALSELNFG